MPKLKHPPSEEARRAVGLRLKSLRTGRKLTVRALARELGDEKRYRSEISRAETGEKMPSKNLVDAIESRFGVRIAQPGFVSPTVQRVEREHVSPNLAAFIAQRAASGSPISPSVRGFLEGLRNEVGDLSLVGWQDAAEDAEVAGRRAARGAKLPNRADQDEDV
jgi:transcriptional regulator with XRE-family HTH domain